MISGAIDTMLDNDAPVSTAAAKVFAIPELLQHIIIQIIEDYEDPYYGIDDSSERVQSQLAEKRQSHMQWMKVLFRLQRVNTAFQSTIQRSRACRRAMFLEHTYEEGEHGDEQYLAKAQFHPLLHNILSLKRPLQQSKIRGNELCCWLSISETPRLQDEPYCRGWLSTRQVKDLPQPELPGDGTGSWQQSLICNMLAKVKVEVLIRVESGERYQEDAPWQVVTTLGELVELFEDQATKGKEIMAEVAVGEHRGDLQNWYA